MTLNSTLLRCIKCGHLVTEWTLTQRKLNDGMCPMCGGALVVEIRKEPHWNVREMAEAREIVKASE